MSIEVGEHIPPGPTEQAFLENLDRHARLGCVLSWSDAAEADQLHINPLTEAELAAKLAPYGLHLDLEASAGLRAAATFPWLQGIAVYRRGGT